jgi:hypothetical protein
MLAHVPRGGIISRPGISSAGPDNVEKLARINIFVHAVERSEPVVCKVPFWQTFGQDVVVIVERMLRHPCTQPSIDSLVTLNLMEASASPSTGTSTSTTKFAPSTKEK